MLNDQELLRYSRQYILPEIGIDGQEKIKNAKVLVVGAGGLGCPVLQYLCAAGVGTIGIADFDKVDLSNLQRQILYSESEIGQYKAEVAAKKLSLQNSSVQYNVITEKLDSSNILNHVKEYDIVVDGCDNFTTRYIVNDACVLADKPLVFGSIFKFEGQISVLNYQGSGSYRCLFPQPLAEEELPNCSVIGVLGVLPGIVGSIQATEVIKIILQKGEVLAGKLLVVDALTMNFQTYGFQKDPANFNISSLQEAQQKLVISKSDVEEITVHDLEQMISSQEGVQLVDVRENDEYAKRNIGGIHIPLQLLRKNAGKIKKDVPVVVYCQSGSRSRQAIRMLKNEFGFSNVKNLQGGLNSWYAAHN